VKKRVAVAADQAIEAWSKLMSEWVWRDISTKQKLRQAIVEFATTIQSVNGALVAVCPDDPEAEET